MRMECWRTWWAELGPSGRAQWSAIAAERFLTTEQLRRLQYEGLLMAGYMTRVDGKARMLVPAELLHLAGHRNVMSA